MNEHHYIIEERDSVVIRFAGDSGDGMQLTGTQFTNTSAVFGNDVSTMPDFPAEIRAPVGTLAGVSGFQVNFSNRDILTPGDAAQILVAMNPAALKASLSDVETHGTIIINTDAFSQANLRKAGYESDPRHDGSLKEYKIIEVPLTSLNREALKGIEGLSTKEKDRSQNFFALGLAFWMFDRSLDVTVDWINKKFAKTPAVREGNIRALETGYNFGDTSRIFQQRYRIRPASLPPGTYRKVTGNNALAMGFGHRRPEDGQTAFLRHVSHHPRQRYPPRPGSAAQFRRAHLSGRGRDRRDGFGHRRGLWRRAGRHGNQRSRHRPQERGHEPGPGSGATGWSSSTSSAAAPAPACRPRSSNPTCSRPCSTATAKAPMAILAPSNPSDCFDVAIEACRLAVRTMSPVIILSDGFLANSSEPWMIPNADNIAPIEYSHPEGISGNGHEPFLSYKRDPDTMARPWAIPGTPGLEHRIGGLSKAPVTGNVSYNPLHHEQMVRERAEKIARLAEFIPEQDVFGPASGELLLLSWGGTFGSVRSAVAQAQRRGLSVAHAHLRYLNPFPRNLRDILGRYRQVIVPELNGGQLAFLLRGRYALDIQSYTKVHGRPFTIGEISHKIEQVLG